MHHLCHCDPCRCAESGAKRPANAVPGTRPQRMAYRKRHCADAQEVEEPPPGAHLVTPRRGYTHHGIYAGDGMVVHYSGLSRGLGRGPVEEVTLARFANGQSIAIRCRGPLPFGMLEIVRRARSRLGEARYRLLSNNCEHFSEWAQSGLNYSTQVDRWLRAPLAVTTALAQRLRAALVVPRLLSDRLLASHEGVAEPG